MSFKYLAENLEHFHNFKMKDRHLALTIIEKEEKIAPQVSSMYEDSMSFQNSMFPDSFQNNSIKPSRQLSEILILNEVFLSEDKNEILELSAIPIRKFRTEFLKVYLSDDQAWALVFDLDHHLQIFSISDQFTLIVKFFILF